MAVAVALAVAVAVAVDVVLLQPRLCVGNLLYCHDRGRTSGTQIHVTYKVLVQSAGEDLDFSFTNFLGQLASYASLGTYRFRKRPRRPKSSPGGAQGRAKWSPIGAKMGSIRRTNQKKTSTQQQDGWS